MVSYRYQLLLVFLFVLILTYIIVHIYRFYSKLKRYPNGPRPLPLIGNALMLAGNLNRHPTFFYQKLAKSYGDIYTFWLGTKPIVIISDIDMANEAFNKSACNDRIEMFVHNEVSNTYSDDHPMFIFMNNNDDYKIARKIAAKVIRKFMQTNEISEITHQLVDENVAIMLNKECGKEFVPFSYISNIFIRASIEITLGKKLELEDTTSLQIAKVFELLQLDLIKQIFSGYLPIVKFLVKLTMNISKTRQLASSTTDILKNWYINCKDENFNTPNSFSKLLITYKDKYESNYFTDKNSVGILYVLFGAGSDTSIYTFKWLLLYMCYHQEMQQRMRDEISYKIGDKVPEISDLGNCHYVKAFISETLRYKAATPMSVFHTTSSDTRIANKSVPKNTMILLSQYSIMRDSRYWKNPEDFNPERFLDCNHEFITSPMPAFIPFGTGKRMCIGDKFATNMIFLVLSRLLQQTNGYQILLADKLKTDFEPKSNWFLLEPKEYRIKLLKND